MTTDPDISAKADRLRAEAAALPSLDEVRQLAERAVAHGGTEQMSLDEIRALATQAVAQAEEVNVLLRRLVTLQSPPAGGEL